MVLPASTAAEGEAAQAEWLRQVRRWLHLGHKGVLVMIRDAQLAQLRPLVRTLESVDPSLTVTGNAAELLACSKGALVLLIVNARDLGWLNLNRPIFEQRALRVVLWVEPELSGRLKFESPDLHDWISHFVPCPEGVPEFAVEGLRIGSSWWPGVAWHGPGLTLALAQLKIDVTTLRPDAEFESLVSTLSADRRSCIRWVGVDSLRELWRVRWALAEARHHGFCVLAQPSVSTPGWFPVSSLQLAVADAEVFIEGENRQRRAIELELEPERILPKQDESVSEEVEVGLLLRPGPTLRRLHGSPEIANWRRELVRAIRREPERAWSRTEVAVFASLERDRQRWPDWLGEPRRRHLVEHFLRVRAKNQDLSSLSAAILDDDELVARWGSDEAAIPTDKQLGKRIWEPNTYRWIAPSMQQVLELGHTFGWDTSLTAQAIALATEQLLDQSEPLRTFVDTVLEAAQADLGPKDSALLPLIQITSIAIALAGNPWAARDRLEEVASEWPGPVPFGLDHAAARVLCGEYTQAADRLRRLARGDSAETRLYVAVLLAAGQVEQARTELERLIGEAREPSDYLGDLKNANDRAREFLRERLHALAQPVPS
jgi:hypothetical protein